MINHPFRKYLSLSVMQHSQVQLVTRHNVSIDYFNRLFDWFIRVYWSFCNIDQAFMKAAKKSWLHPCRLCQWNWRTNCISLGTIIVTMKPWTAANATVTSNLYNSSYVTHDLLAYLTIIILNGEKFWQLWIFPYILRYVYELQNFCFIVAIYGS